MIHVEQQIEGATLAYAARISGAQSPAVSAEAREQARSALLDFLACALAAHNDTGFAALQAALPASLPATCTATVLGQRGRRDRQTAALLNGYLGHALDFDDVHLSVRGHPSTVIWPALLAVAESTGAAAERVLDAYVVGLEAMARLGLATGVRQYEQGFHSTSTLGPIGAAAALCRLLALDEAATARALGVAATQAGGLRLQFGTPVKPLHAGLAARSAVFSLDLVGAGLQGAQQFLDGPIGFPAVFGAAPQDLARAWQGWGEPWQILSPGLQVKQYACCNATHYAADAMLALRAEHGLCSADVASIHVLFPVGGDAALRRELPRSGTEGKFSIEYVLVAALELGELPLSIFTDRPVEPSWLPRMQAVQRAHDCRAPAASTDPASRFSTVTITTHDGRVLTRRVDKPAGVRSVVEKFRAVSDSHAELARVPALVAQMRDAADLNALFALLVHTPELPQHE
jgi:2-methylcitrate dehydratase PrpD